MFAFSLFPQPCSGTVLEIELHFCGAKGSFLCLCEWCFKTFAPNYNPRDSKPPNCVCLWP